ncbi:MAG TPA: 50S ribosomal protein L35 [Spirochaetota bacterium]|nr:50S ribosomal protein L35 [Spirochaetota bacterium]
MPKMKSNSGAKKRFKITAKKKVVHGMQGKRHLLTAKPTGRKRSLRGTGVLAPMDAAKVRRCLPYA